jgi:hypothetical protein
MIRPLKNDCTEEKKERFDVILKRVNRLEKVPENDFTRSSSLLRRSQFVLNSLKRGRPNNESGSWC